MLFIWESPPPGTVNVRPVPQTLDEEFERDVYELTSLVRSVLVLAIYVLLKEAKKRHS